MIPEVAYFDNFVRLYNKGLYCKKFKYAAIVTTLPARMVQIIRNQVTVKQVSPKAAALAVNEQILKVLLQ